VEAAYVIAHLASNTQNILRHCGREHHNLFLVRSHLKNFLYVSAHICRNNMIELAVQIRSCILWNVMILPIWDRSWSHSSKMNLLSLSIFIILLWTRSFTRPGVPHTMWGGSSSNIFWWIFFATPPKMASLLMFSKNFPNLWNSALIWNAISRVCTSTSVSIIFFPLSFVSGRIWWRVARTKTAVFPIPAFSWQMISWPWIAWGMHICWTVTEVP